MASKDPKTPATNRLLLLACKMSGYDCHQPSVSEEEGEGDEEEQSAREKMNSNYVVVML